MKNIIEMKKLNKIYGNGKLTFHALKDIDLAVESGDYMAIMGTSGSGKSTLMHLLGCLDKPTSGEYILDGIKLSNMSEAELCHIRNKKIGFVFQAYNLLPNLNLIENIELPMLYAKTPKNTREAEAKKLLRIVGLEKWAEHKPSEISGGQKQRVAIARSLANNPSIILADEPTGNLDSKSESEILEIFQRLNKEGKTILIVTHDMHVGEEAKKIINIRDGNILSIVSRNEENKWN